MTCDILDPQGYLSQCFVDASENVLGIILLASAAWRIHRLEKLQPVHHNSSTSVGGLVAFWVIACVSHNEYSINFQNLLWFIVLTVTVTLRYVQIGRRDLPLPEVLWYLTSQAVFIIIRLFSDFSWLNAMGLANFLSMLVLEYRCMPPLPLGYETSTIFGKIAVTYIEPLLKIAENRQLDRQDFPLAPGNLNSFLSFSTFQQQLEKHDPRATYRVIFALIRTLRWKIVVISALEVVSDLIVYLRPLLLAFFLKSLSLYKQGKESIYPSIYYACLLSLVQMVGTSMSSLQSLTSNMAFVTSRSALMGSIYRKALDLSSKSRETYQGAKIMNLLNVDTAMVQLIYRQIPTLLGAPLGLLVCTWQLYRFLGWTTLAALPVYALFIPYSSWYTKRMFKRFPELMKVKDKRTKATWNIFQSMKSLKLYAWEAPYAERVMNVRKQEIGIQAKYLRLQAAMNSVSIMLDDFVATAIFIAFLYFTGKALTPDIVFPILSLLSLLSEPFFAFPRAVSSIGRAITSQKRINDFLTQEEYSSKNYFKLLPVPALDTSTPTVRVEGATLYWTEDIEPEKLALEKVSLEIRRGDLCCIVGRVGTGKTALLRGICGQMNISAGAITVKGDVAYCSQEPWLQFKTIKDNILFGLQYDEPFYKKTLAACQLNSDLELFPDRDDTEIGEKGVSLSGGQKARVALARAVYSRADIFVLDDILAAVDEHVAKRLTAELLSPTGMLAGKAVILATNSRKVLRFASEIVVLEDKTVKAQGGIDSAAMDLALGIGRPSSPATEENSGQDDELSTSTPNLINRQRQLKVQPPPRGPIVDVGAPFKAVQAQQQKAEEEDHRSNVIMVFRRYLSSVGTMSYVIAVTFLVLSVVFLNLIVIWLTIWSDKELSGLKASEWYATVYLLLSICEGISLFLGLYWFLGAVGNTASIRLHNSMLESVLRSPMMFFESTPLGSIMNRFTGDVSTLDSTLPNMIYFFSRSVLRAIISFSIMIAGAPFVLAILIPLLFLYNNYRKYYIPASRQLQRMSSASRGPILSHIEESVKGVSTVRAFDTASQFIDIYEARSDYWMQTVFMRVSLNQWLTWRINGMTALLTLSSALCMVLLVYYTDVAVGVVGVVLYSTQNGGQMLSRIIRSIADLEVSAIAVERVFEYTDLGPEAPLEMPNDPDVEEWPNSGEVSLVNYSTQYKPAYGNVLHEINLAIKSKERIGIVGRTGAGKSTISLAIFRLIEPTHGNIEIDRQNTSDLGLHTLRSRLSIIPQDAQIFEGTLRENLDPLGTVDDQRLWQVLELCHLKDHFSRTTSGLDTGLAEGGDNLSRGQAQLICLGRSLVRESKILILDEATASVDTETDKIVQQTIRSQFNDRTIITVAHRLDTIMESDRVVVLDKGKIKEFDTPANLLAAKGLFYGLTQAQQARHGEH